LVNKRQIARAEQLERVLHFLRGIGIPCLVDARTRTLGGFLNDVRIDSGGLIVKSDALVSNALHEAGHLAVLPGKYRRMASDDVDEVAKFMLDETANEPPDSPLSIATMQCGDVESTAWAWAAGVYLGVAPQDIIRHEQYGRTGVQLRYSLAAHAYIGINGLSRAGFCVVRPGVLEKHRGLPAYPKLAMWVQKDFDTCSTDVSLLPPKVTLGMEREFAV
jgi:hypothetical protein